MLFLAALPLASVTPSGPPSNQTAPSLLFTSLSAASDVTGLLVPVGSTLSPGPAGLKSPVLDSITIYAGLLPNRTFEIFTVQNNSGAVTVARHLSQDLKSYLPQQVVLAGPGLLGASIARDRVSGKYLMLAFSLAKPAGAGLQSPPAGAPPASTAVAYASGNGCDWAPVHPDRRAAYAVPAGGASGRLLAHPTLGWLAFQRTLQTLSAAKPFPDDIGSHARRVVEVLSSTDGGATWSPSTEPLVPGAVDPPEMELWSLIPFEYGGSVAAVASNYVPSPAVVASRAPAPRNTSAPGASVVDAPMAPGGIITAQEWWVASGTPTGPSGWSRPYAQQSQLATNVGPPGTAGLFLGAAAPRGFCITHAPVFVPQNVGGGLEGALFWHWAGEWWGLMLWRVGGLRAPANAAFTTQPFVVERGLWLDMDSRWGAKPGACSPFADECSSYALVELLDAAGGSVLPGFEHANSGLLGLHANQQGYPLGWTLPNGTALQLPVGRTVRARIFLRDATVFSLGTGTSWATTKP